MNNSCDWNPQPDPKLVYPKEGLLIGSPYSIHVVCERSVLCKTLIWLEKFLAKNPEFTLDGLIRQNLCGNGNWTGTDTMSKYRSRLSSHISCSVKCSI